MLHELNEKHADMNPLDTELSARVFSYELAFWMQTSAPEAIATFASSLLRVRVALFLLVVISLSWLS